jgi:hypothetical protein
MRTPQKLTSKFAMLFLLFSLPGSAKGGELNIANYRFQVSGVGCQEGEPLNPET